MSKAFELSPSRCRFRAELTQQVAAKTEAIFEKRYFDKKIRWTGLDENGQTIDGAHRSDPRYYYTSPLSRLSGSGTGSNLGIATSVSVMFLASVIADFKVETMIDAPCGDANWQFQAWEVDSIRAFVGLDIVHAVIDLNARRYAFHSNKIFSHWDFSRCPLPRIRWLARRDARDDAEARPAVTGPPVAVDLVHMRDVLQHLRSSSALRALHNVMSSGARLLVATTFPSDRGAGKGAAANATSPLGAGRRLQANNRKILEGNFFAADLLRSPFNLPRPLRCEPTHPHLEADLTCVWRLDNTSRHAWLREHARVMQPTAVDDGADGFEMPVSTSTRSGGRSRAG